MAHEISKMPMVPWMAKMMACGTGLAYETGCVNVKGYEKEKEERRLEPQMDLWMAQMKDLVRRMARSMTKERSSGREYSKMEFPMVLLMTMVE